MKVFLNKILFVFIVVVSLNIVKLQETFADNDMQYVYTTQASDPSYNIFTGDTWDLSPYIQAGYSFLWAGHRDNNGMPYEGMLRNRHSGFNFGLGIIINRYWSFGLSFHKVYKTSTMRDYAIDYPYIDSIKQESYLVNFDMSLMAPFSFFNRNMRLYLLTGPSIIFSSLEYNYNAGKTNGMVPIEQTQGLNKTQIGINLGIGISYNLTKHLYARMEGRKIFIISKNPALKNTFSMNIILGIAF